MINEISSEITNLLQNYYKITDKNTIPVLLEFSKWKNENKFGFLNGVLMYGETEHKLEILNAFNQDFSIKEAKIISKLFDYYILPYHKGYNNASCKTPERSIVGAVLGSDYVPRILQHSTLKKSLISRDGVCLFCWVPSPLKAAHIISQNELEVDEKFSSAYKRCGLQSMHQVQNGLLLCANCHDHFEKLQRYVDQPDGKLILEIVNKSNDAQNHDWVVACGLVQVVRGVYQKSFTDKRKPSENDQVELWFKNTDCELQPNRKALQGHKIACMIWKLSGGTEPDQDCYSDVSYSQVDDFQMFRLQKYISQNHLFGDVLQEQQEQEEQEDDDDSLALGTDAEIYSSQELLARFE